MDTRVYDQWPLPGRLEWATSHDSDWPMQVDVELLDGSHVRGAMHHLLTCETSLVLAPSSTGQPAVIELARIRRIAPAQRLSVRGRTTSTMESSLNYEQSQLLNFRITFLDGDSSTGLTWSYLTQKPWGLFLYVRQSSMEFQTIWYPWRVLRVVHLDRAELALDLTPPPPSRSGALASARNPTELLDALDRQRHQPVRSLASVMSNLGLIDSEAYQAVRGDSPKLLALISQKIANHELTEEDLEHARARLLKTPEVDVANFEVEGRALVNLPWAIAAKHTVAPLCKISDTLYVASAHPLDMELQDRLELLAGCHVVLVWTSAPAIEARLMHELQHSEGPAAAPKPGPAPAKDAGPGMDPRTLDMQSLLASAQDEIRVYGVQAASSAVDESSSVVLLVKRLIMDAYLQKASDIHIETNPEGQQSRVRFRKDGDLEEYLQMPADLRSALISRIKVMSKLDITERRRPQDGKINFAEYSNIKLELRVAVLPTHDNLEDVVLRLLASSKPIPLAQLGFAARDEKQVKTMSQRPYGLILACGPTGSGKTTSLHSMLSEINTTSRKIWTTEDPIEITQAGLRQLQVNPKIGVTFASAMRAFLRADPDVIMIGEIRDEETARISIEASLTGHLVLSTLHTNNAAESVARLLDLGMDPMNFADSLIGIVAQRLVRALCKACKHAKPLDETEFDALAAEYVDGTGQSTDEARQRLLKAAGAESPRGVSLYQAVGCPACNQNGRKGRLGIYEILENESELKHLIQTRATTSAIFRQTIAHGTRSLKQDALEKVFAGKVDLAQARTIYQ